MPAVLPHPAASLAGRLAILAPLAITAGLASPARAEEVDTGTASAMQAVISQQLDAFGRDDAAAAESFAAPGIKTRFPDPKDFLAMVRQSYGALIQPRTTRFNKAGSSALGPMQAVTVIDKAGQAWTAVYTFEQIDGQWRINGCALVKEPGTNV